MITDACPMCGSKHREPHCKSPTCPWWRCRQCRGLVDLVTWVQTGVTLKHTHGGVRMDECAYCSGTLA